MQDREDGYLINKNLWQQNEGLLLALFLIFGVSSEVETESHFKCPRTRTPKTSESNPKPQEATLETSLLEYSGNIRH